MKPFTCRTQKQDAVRSTPAYVGGGVDVGAVGGDAGGAGDIVKGEGGDERVELHEQREGCQMPPAAPRTATFRSGLAAEEELRQRRCWAADFSRALIGVDVGVGLATRVWWS
jgi:hypothetical protein